MISKSKILALALALSPVMAMAQTVGTFNGEYFTSMSTTFATIIGNLIPAFMGLGFIAFFWFLFHYITSSGEDKVKQKAGLMWSVIAIVIMISIFGLASLLQNIFGTGAGNSNINAPTITR